MIPQNLSSYPKAFRRPWYEDSQYKILHWCRKNKLIQEKNWARNVETFSLFHNIVQHVQQLDNENKYSLLYKPFVPTSIYKFPATTLQPVVSISLLVTVWLKKSKYPSKQKCGQSNLRYLNFKFKLTVTPKDPVGYSVSHH